MRVGVDFGYRKMTHYCSIEWLATYSNLDVCVWMLYSDDKSVASLVETFCQQSDGHFAWSLS